MDTSQDLTSLKTAALESLGELPQETVQALHPTDYSVTDFIPGMRRSAFPERGSLELPSQPSTADVEATMDEALDAPVIITGDNAPSAEIDEEQARWNAFARGEDVQPPAA